MLYTVTEQALLLPAIVLEPDESDSLNGTTYFYEGQQYT